MQNPHCTPPSSTNASLRMRRVSSGRPSTVTTSLAVHLLRFPEARQRGMSVDEDQAAAAGALRRAAVLDRHHAAFLAQNFEEMHSRLVRDV